MRTNLIVAFSLIALVWVTQTTARTYRWTDENGVTIYSQSPPPSGKATIIKPPPPPDTPPGETMQKLKERLNAIDEANKKKQEAKEEKDKEAKNAKIKKQNCTNAKENLAALELHPRIRKKMEDGSYKMLTDEERTADIEKAKNAIKKYCE